jgi:glycerophosphoryl diester phosphodiesterase
VSLLSGCEQQDCPLGLRDHSKGGRLNIITWTLERSQPAPFPEGLSFYYEGTEGALQKDGDYLMHTLDVLNKEVGILGIFSDWPATVTYYANCMGL